MPINSTSKAYLEIHLAVFLFGFTAILGELISIDNLSLVWWRLLLTCSVLFFFFNIGKHLKSLKTNILLHMAGIGGLVALHWVLFFGSIKASNASITLICVSTSSFMTAILEPFVSKKKHSKLDLLLGVIIIPAMFMIVRNVEMSMHVGIILGLFSALVAVVFTIWNKQIVGEVNAYTLTFVELGFGFLFLSIYSLVKSGFLFSRAFAIPHQMDWVYLFTLAVFCTCIGYSLSINALKELTAFTSNLTINLEPVYGIILASILLNQHKELSTNFYIGGVIIILAVVAHPVAKRLQRKRNANV